MFGVQGSLLVFGVLKGFARGFGVFICGGLGIRRAWVVYALVWRV